jgi:hypothetical protein
MDGTHTLTRHRDIQNWVSDRKGIPAIVRVRDRFGAQRSKLAIRFAQQAAAAAAQAKTESVDDGLSPVAWSAWLAELDRQGLALRVGQQKQFEFVERRDTSGVH